MTSTFKKCLFVCDSVSDFTVNNILLVGDLDAEDPDMVHAAHQKMATLSSCFAQLTHKAQTVFQNSAKVEVSGYAMNFYVHY